MRKLALLALLFLPMLAAAQARQRATLWCELGGQRAIVNGVESRTFEQGSFPACTVNVYATGTTTPVAICSDVACGTPLSNPFTATSSGLISFFVQTEPSTVDVAISGSTLSTPFTYPAIQLCAQATCGGSTPGTDIVITDPVSTQTITQPGSTHLGVVGELFRDTLGLNTGTWDFSTALEVVPQTNGTGTPLSAGVACLHEGQRYYNIAAPANTEDWVCHSGSWYNRLAGGDITSAPAGNQTINQAFVSGAKTSFCANVDAGTVKLCPSTDPTLNWSQSPTSPATLAVSANVVTITCPKGLTTTAVGKDFHVYVAGTGTPEWPLVTATSCAGDGTTGTVTFTAANTHSAGYTVGTASSGLKEASEYSTFLNTGSIAPANRGGVVEIDPSATLNIYGNLNIEAYNQIIRFNGATVSINVPFSTTTTPDNLTTFNCGLTIGTNTSSGGGASGGNRIFGLTGLRANVPAAAGFCLSSQNTYVDEVGMLAPATASGNYFEHVLIGYKDEGAVIGRVQKEQVGTGNFICTATDCPSFLYGFPGISSPAIFHILDMNVTFINDANGVDWQSANTLMIDHLIIQNPAQFYGKSNSGFVNNMNVIIGSTYFEGACSANPTGLGCMGWNFQSGISKIGLGQVDAALPRYANTGGTNYFYWVCPYNAVAQAGNCLLAGYSQLTTTGTYDVKWYDISPGGTFDVIRWATNSVAAPTTATCTGGTVAACGTIATGVNEATACDATTHVCTFTDDIAVATSAYTVPTPIFYPKVDFWPAAYVVGPSAATTTVTNGAKLLLDAYTAGGDSVSGGIVNVFGANANSVIAQTCTNAADWTTTGIVCLNFPANVGGATWFRPQTSAGTGALQGRLTFAQQPGLALQSTDLITYKSADPQLTFATNFLRPAWQATDTACGYETAGSGGYYCRDSHALREYIGKVPDNAPQWQLLSTGASTPLVITSTLATGSAPFVVASTTKVANLNVDQTDGVSLLKLTATLSPTAVGANTCAGQSFTVTGIVAGDYIFVNKPTSQAGLGVSGVRASGTNTAEINFCNNTVSPITPTASEVYAFGVLR